MHRTRVWLKYEKNVEIQNKKPEAHQNIHLSQYDECSNVPKTKKSP